MKTRNLISLLAVSFLISSAFIIRIGLSAPALLKIYLDPAEITANPGESFTVSVKIVDAHDVIVIQVLLAWKTPILQFIDIEEGDFPGRGGVRETVFYVKNFSDQGYIAFWNGLPGATRGEDGSGTLAKITFRVEEAGETGLHLYNVGLLNSFERDIPYTLEDGYVNVAAPRISVEPSTTIDALLLPGDSFNLNVSISNVENLLGFQFKLGYDATLLNATQVSVVPFLDINKTGEKYGVNITNNLGFVWVNVNFTAEQPLSGSEVLLHINFTVQNVGECIIDIYDAKLNDKLARLRDPPFQHDAVGDDGYFSNMPPPHDIVVTKITALPTKVTVGESVTINVTVANAGSYNETFDLTLYYGLNVIEKRTAISLVTGANEVLTFEWNTEGVAAGSYKIKAEASIVEGEENIANNIREFSAIVVEASPGPSLTLYAGVGIGVAVVIGLIVYFVKVRKPK